MVSNKLVTLALTVFVMSLSIAGCSSMESESVADHHVGPVGPTYPSLYYFEATVTPHTVVPPATAIFMVRVFDSNGNLVPNVPVYALGADESTMGETDYSGIARFSLVIASKGGGGISGYVLPMTFSVEDTSLTIPVQVAPAGGA
ncbi:MAG: hypothetical protein OEZ04_00775 [Nitrospinota bacterium]|nr:hypothetical protein [Nitrospinota bacterium]